MAAGLGIDFGTTNSSACIFDGHEFGYVDLEARARTIPTLLYVDREFRPEYGEAARTRFLRENEGRRIRLESLDVGYIEITLGDNAYESYDHTGFDPGPTSFDARVSGVTDRELPGFLFAGTKRLLGQSAVDSVRVFDRNFRLEAVVSSIVQYMCRAVEARTEMPLPRNVCVGRPVNYECSGTDAQASCNDRALERMTRALGHTGIVDYSFFLEPIAPVLTYVHEHVDTSAEGETLLVLDFGGGTLDFSLVRRVGGFLRVEGNFGRALGGDIITELLIRDHFLPLLGLDDRTLEEARAVHHELDALLPHVLNWRTTYMLNQPAFLGELAQAMTALPERATALNRCRRLIVGNFGYNLFHAVDTAKQKLSVHDSARIELGQIGIDVELTRADLERSLEPYLASVSDSIALFCDELADGRTSIDRVLLTGGTSLIPAIRRRIDETFPVRVVSVDPFMSIVKGFALAAWMIGEDRIYTEDNHMSIRLAPNS